MAYFCMYAFRKPFAAATFAGQHVGELELKIALVISQVVGYALAKFLSIKFVTELSPDRRSMALLALIGTAEASLVVFGLAPPAGRVAALFFNGLALGGVWGLVFGFLEGRRTSEILGAGLSASYIVASGAVKSVGGWLLTQGVSEAWMPAVTGLLFAPPFALAVFLLGCLPAPDSADVVARTARAPMQGDERRGFFRRFALGLLALTGLYMFLTAYRDFRDNFAAELWTELGMGDTPAIFTLSEIPVAMVVLVLLAATYRVRDNRRAFFFVHLMMGLGAAAIGVATLARDLGWLGPIPWMVTIGVGLYMGYVPFGSVLFDRLIAATGVVGTAVFMIYVTDAFGYVGSIIVLLVRNFVDLNLSWLDFFRGFSYTTSAVCIVGYAISAIYFRGKMAGPSGRRPAVFHPGNR